MPRLPLLDPPYAGNVAATFDAIMPPNMPPLTLFRLLAGHGRAWQKFRAASLLDKGPLPLRDREIVINRVCARTHCEYEWGVHVTLFADAANLTREQVDATVAVAADSACWSPREQALITAVDALHEQATWSDREFMALQTHFDSDQIMEILLLSGFYRTVAYIANGLALPLEEGAARFPMATDKTGGAWQ